MDIFCRDKKLNLSGSYLKPGFAFGGSCLPKDLRAIVYMARMLEINAPLLKAISQSNKSQIKHVVRQIMSLKKKKVGVLGIAFKAGIDDLRESPAIELVEILLSKGCQVKIYDRNITPAALVGTNKQFIEKKMPGIGRLMVKDMEEILRSCEVIVLTNNDKQFRGLFSALGNKQYLINLTHEKVGFDIH